MRINEKGTNMPITEAIRDYLYKKLAYLDKFVEATDDSVICDVELGRITGHHKNGDVFMTEINLNVGGQRFRAVANMPDLFASIDVAKDEMIRELQSQKDRRVSSVRRGGAKVKNFIKGLFNNSTE